MNRRDIPLILICCFVFLIGFMDRTMAKNEPVKIALCQIVSLDGDREGNFVRIENALAEASAKGAQIACFPETVIYGWVNPDAYQRAFPIPGEDATRLCRLAQKYNLFLCAGLAEKEGDALHDSVILVDDDGTILLKHRKINILKNLMDPPYTPGSEILAADTRFGRIGLLICADTFVPEILQSMANNKPNLVLVPYGWAAPEAAWPDHGKKLHETVCNAAKIIGAPVVGTDGVAEITHGPWTGQIYGGQSIAADKLGNPAAIAKDRDRDILVVTIPLGR